MQAVSASQLAHAAPAAVGSLGNRLALATLGFSLVFTVLTVGVRTWLTWEENLVAMGAELTVIEQVYQSTLTKAIWEVDPDALQKHLESTGSMAAVGKIMVRPSSTKLGVLEYRQPGWKASTVAPVRHVTLSYQQFSGADSETVGEMWLYGDERVLWTRLRNGVRDIVLTQIIQFLLLSGLLILMFNRTLTVHIERIAAHLGGLTPDNLDRPLVLERKLARPDELTLLVAGVNALQQKLHLYLQEKLRYEHALARHRDQMRERSDELAQANIALVNSADTLRQLGDIGKDLTMNLNREAICVSLRAHLEHLLPLDVFVLAVRGRAPDTLDVLYHSADGELVAPACIALGDPHSILARACRDGNDLMIFDESELVLALQPAAIAKGAPVRSALVRTLVANGELVGVVSVQSRNEFAFQIRELEVFNTAASYATIALVNAGAYEAADAAWQQAARALDDLRQAQSLLIQSEKMAALGQLIASVAHEINTPIGAVKSSGRNIVDSLAHTLDKLPQVFQQLGDVEQALFVSLVGHASGHNEVLSTREERAMVRDIAHRLEQIDIADARHKAGVFAQLRVGAALLDYLPLLRHPSCELILDTAYSMTTIASNTANINTAVDRVTKIIFALKSFSRFDRAGEMVEADLRAGIETVLTIYHNQIKQNTELVRHYEEIEPIRCLPDELNQVWTNLIHNALQAMNYKGTLTVTIQRVSGQAVVSIGDSGCGISPEIRDRIFDAFFTTKPAGEGSGLGLDIVKKIIDKHRGSIEVASEAGRGAVFSIHLPYVQEAV